MDQERWQQIDNIFEAVLDRPAADRPTFLASECAGDRELRAEVESLLAAHDQQDNFLERPGAADGVRLPAAREGATLVGETFGNYRIVRRLGTGGMSEVYLAQDTRLARPVAIKLLAPHWAADDEQVRRFRREALAASALNHPNILTIYEVGEWHGRDFIATEFVDGVTLRESMCAGNLPIAVSLDIAQQIAGALAAAHGAGIVHRDIKPENVMVRPDGLVKVLDFGIAKLARPRGAAASNTGPTTAMGMVFGTAAYVSPEQARGQTVDARSDIWSLGVVIYELIAGRRPFPGATPTDLVAAILERVPEPLREVRRDAPARLETIVSRALAKNREERYSDAGALAEDLRKLRAGLGEHRWQPFRSRMRMVAAALALLLLLALTGAWYYRRGAPARWAREVALPEINRLVAVENNTAAFPLLYQALQALPTDPALNKIRRAISSPTSIRTTPPGASVYLKPYGRPDNEWLFIGQSPLEDFLLPIGYFRWRITEPGFRTVEAAAGIGATNFILDPEGAIPAEMVHVPRGDHAMFSFPPVHVDDFWMDKYEVTNKQFKEFVDKGGYQKPQYWREEFVKAGRVLSREQAMLEFRDATGQPGPATWEVGDYPRGHDDFPVSGVSWYEAAAYAEFAKKHLPTVYHWYHAASQRLYSDMLQFSNFDGIGPVRVGSRRSLGEFGTYDMAGNVKEWCWNASGNRRYILRGGWNESRIYYIANDALSPFDRSPANGFRCVKYPGGVLSDALTRPVEPPPPDRRMEKPISDSEFRILQSFYSYDRTELKAVTESVDESSPYWRAEKITFDAAYDHQRVIAWLYLPRNRKPPYQTIIFFPSGHSRTVKHIDEAEISRMDFLIKSGRAVLFPVYQGTFERQLKNEPGPSGLRDLTIQQCKDLLRSVDYLETRTDIARDRLGFFGVSGGGHVGLIALALEPRIQAAALASTRLRPERPSPEVDEINFAPRVRVPVLLMNGRDDFLAPVETRQLPLLRLLGTPEKDKRLALFDSGHAGPTHLYIKDALDWFDRYLGPVSK